MPSRVTLGIIGVLLLALSLGAAYHFSSEATNAVTIGNLNTEVKGLEDSNKMLKASVDSFSSALSAKKTELESYKELHTYSDARVVELQDKIRIYELRIGKLKGDIEDLKKGMSNDEIKLLNTPIPQSIITLSTGTGTPGL